MTDFVVTKLDVLTGLDKVPICVAYDVDGVRHDEMPVNQSDFHHAKPICEEMDGWWEDLTGCRAFEDSGERAGLHPAGRGVDRRPISAIGVGPERDAIISRFPLLDWSSARGRRPRRTGNRPCAGASGARGQPRGCWSSTTQAEPPSNGVRR